MFKDIAARFMKKDRDDVEISFTDLVLWVAQDLSESSTEVKHLIFCHISHDVSDTKHMKRQRACLCRISALCTVPEAFQVVLRTYI